MLTTVIRADNVIQVMPSTVIVKVWRNLISAIYSHPTLLFHEDVKPLRTLLNDYGAFHESRTTDIFVPIKIPELMDHSQSPQVVFPQSPLQMLFSEINECQIEPGGIWIKSCSLSEIVKQGIAELVEFVRSYPQGLYNETFTFIYHFMVRFGVSPKIIEAVVDNAVVDESEINTNKYERVEGNEDTELGSGNTEDVNLKASLAGYSNNEKSSESSSSEQEDSSSSEEDEDAYLPSSLPKLPRPYRPWSFRERCENPGEKRKHVYESRNSKITSKLKKSAVASANYRKQRSAVTDVSATNNQSSSKQEPTKAKHYLRFQCSLCEISCSSRKRLVEHFKLRHPGSEFPENVEVRRVNSLFKKKDPPRSFRTDCSVRYHCPKCDKMFLKKRMAEIHLRKIHLTEVVSGIMASRVSDTKYSQLLSNGETKDILGIPSTATTDDTSFTTDVACMEIPLGINTRYQCPYCDLTSVRRDRILTHVSELHTEREEDYTIKTLRIFKPSCPFCIKTFTTTANTIHHIKRIHEKNYLNGNEEYTHITVGTEVLDMFECPNCVKLFTNAANLILHHKYAHPLIPTPTTSFLTAIKNSDSNLSKLVKTGQIHSDSFINSMSGNFSQNQMKVEESDPRCLHIKTEPVCSDEEQITMPNGIEVTQNETAGLSNSFSKNSQELMTAIRTPIKLEPGLRSASATVSSASSISSIFLPQVRLKSLTHEEVMKIRAEIKNKAGSELAKACVQDISKPVVLNKLTKSSPNVKPVLPRTTELSLSVLKGYQEFIKERERERDKCNGRNQFSERESLPKMQDNVFLPLVKYTKETSMLNSAHTEKIKISSGLISHSKTNQDLLSPSVDETFIKNESDLPTHAEKVQSCSLNVDKLNTQTDLNINNNSLKQSSPPEKKNSYSVLGKVNSMTEIKIEVGLNSESPKKINGNEIPVINLISPNMASPKDEVSPTNLNKRKNTQEVSIDVPTKSEEANECDRISSLEKLTPESKKTESKLSSNINLKEFEIKLYDCMKIPRLAKIIRKNSLKKPLSEESKFTETNTRIKNPKFKITGPMPKHLDKLKFSPISPPKRKIRDSVLHADSIPTSSSRSLRKPAAKKKSRKRLIELEDSSSSSDEFVMLESSEESDAEIYLISSSDDESVPPTSRSTRKRQNDSNVNNRKQKQLKIDGSKNKRYLSKQLISSNDDSSDSDEDWTINHESKSKVKSTKLNINKQKNFKLQVKVEKLKDVPIASTSKGSTVSAAGKNNEKVLSVVSPFRDKQENLPKETCTGKVDAKFEEVRKKSKPEFIHIYSSKAGKGEKNGFGSILLEKDFESSAHLLSSNADIVKIKTNQQQPSASKNLVPKVAQPQASVPSQVMDATVVAPFVLDPLTQLTSSKATNLYLNTNIYPRIISTMHNILQNEEETMEDEEYHHRMHGGDNFCKISSSRIPKVSFNINNQKRKIKPTPKVIVQSLNSNVGVPSHFLGRIVQRPRSPSPGPSSFSPYLPHSDPPPVYETVIEETLSYPDEKIVEEVLDLQAEYGGAQYSEADNVATVVSLN